MLAIAAPSFNAPSETFIRNHVQQIAPGRTVLLCNDPSGAQHFGCPVLSPIDPWSLPQTLVERVVNAVRYRWRSYVRPGLTASDRKRVAAYLMKHNVTALLAEYGPTGCLLMDACKDAAVSLFVHFHGYDANIMPRNRREQRQYDKLFCVAERIIAASQFMRRRLISLGCAPERIEIVPCGVDTRRFSPNATNLREPLVLMVSRLIRQKGPTFSLDAFARLAQRFPDLRLEIIGEGPLREDLETQAEAQGIVDRVCLHGAKSHEFVRERLQSARLLIQHCVTLPGEGVESLGLSVLEAMACGVPVVATRHGAITETVQHGVTGLLVAEGDVNGMAEAMAALLTDSDRVAAMGAAGRARVLEHFTIEHTRDRLRAIMGLHPVAPTPVHAV